MGPLTFRTSSAAALDRHERRRGEGIPAVSVLVGDRGLALHAARRWAEGQGRALLPAAGGRLEALVETWLAGLASGRDLAGDALGWLARALGRPAAELASWFGRLTPFEVERFLEVALGDQTDGPAIACVWLLRRAASRGNGPLAEDLAEIFAPAPERALDAVCGLMPRGECPMLLAEPAPGALRTVAEGLARLAGSCPWRSLLVIVESSELDVYERSAPELRAKALVRTGVVPVLVWNEAEVGRLVAQELPGSGPRLAGSVRRLAADGVSRELAESYVAAARATAELAGDAARSAAERFLFERLESLAATIGLFALNEKLPIEFGPGRAMEVDLWAGALGLAVEIDGYYHFQDPEAYRRDRRKDLELQRHGHLVVRILAEDVVERLEDVLDLILDAVASRRGRSRGETS